MNIALLTYSGLPNLVENERRLISLFAAQSVTAKAVIWNDPEVDWATFDALIFRSTWDYFHQPDLFEQWLHERIADQTKAFNAIQTVLKNMHKHYLRDLAAAGVAIVPTYFYRLDAFLTLSSLPISGKCIIKPAISGGAYLTSLFEHQQLAEVQQRMRDLDAHSDWLIQPFLSEIQTSGEVSLIFFNKKYQYAILKMPKKGDFRVQSQFDGQYSPYQPTAETIESAEKILSLYPENLLYARVDGIIIQGQFLLMEVELIEPDLFFNLFDGSDQNFVDTFIELC